jgi:hypothetical protein
MPSAVRPGLYSQSSCPIHHNCRIPLCPPHPSHIPPVQNRSVHTLLSGLLPDHRAGRRGSTGPPYHKYILSCSPRHPKLPAVFRPVYRHTLFYSPGRPLRMSHVRPYHTYRLSPGRRFLPFSVSCPYCHRRRKRCNRYYPFFS